MKRSAGFSRCKQYRYWLKREWNLELPQCVFICLNPSTADASTDDPTLRRIVHFASDWGYGSVVVVNLFAFRASDPRRLWLTEDPVGPRNNFWLRKHTKGAQLVVAAWGNFGGKHQRSRWLMNNITVDLYCLGTTKLGHPRHPLYAPRTTEVCFLR